MKQPEIIYEDADIIVCRKPAGTAVQTRRLGEQDLETLLKNYRAQKKEPPYIGIVHRLDQPVEGVMVFAKNQKAAGSLSAQVREREIGKYYYAVGKRSEGLALVPGEKGTLTDYLGFDKKKNLGYVSNGSDKNAKKAVLDYEVISAWADGTVLFRITLHTGRHHQIRLQLGHLGCPLVGDVKYGGVPAEGLGLCSCRLEFKHPGTGKTMQYEVKPQGPVFAGFEI